MPSVSQHQQRIMGQAWALRTGEISLSDIDKKYRKPIREIAFGKKDKDGKLSKMSDKDLKAFASTKASDLPEYVKDGKPYDKKISEELLKGPGGSTDKIGVKPGIAKIYPFLDVDAKKTKKGKRNLENLKDYRDWLNEQKVETEKYDPMEEYQPETRRRINLDSIRETPEYKRIIDLGFIEDTSYQQSLNNTIKFTREEEIQPEKGMSKVFYTIHPTGTVRRYNPERSKEIPEGSGNDIKVFNKPFERPRDYIKALRYLFQYLRRKEIEKNFR